MGKTKIPLGIHNNILDLEGKKETKYWQSQVATENDEINTKSKQIEASDSKDELFYVLFILCL